MNITVRVIDDATTEPISPKEAKDSANYLLDDKDTFFEILISGCRQSFEKALNRTFHMRRLEAALECFPSCRYIELPYATPLIEIESVTLTDSSQVESVWEASEYLEDIYTGDERPGRLVLAHGESWPSFEKSPVAPIRIRYTAGLPPSPVEECPARIKQLMLLAVGFGFLNRESHFTPDGIVQSVLANPAYASLISSLKVPHLDTWETV